MKPTLVVLVTAAAFLAGLGYERWRGHHSPADSAERKVLYWVDPMHPWYKSDKPGIAPDCGMKLVPVYGDDVATSANADASTMPAGTVQISPEKQQLIGVRYGEAEVRSGFRTIRGVGRVAIDETRIQRVHTKVDGWIDKVLVNFTGAFVKQGDPLLTIYSPDMLAAQRELLLATRAKTMMQNNPLPSAYAQSESLLQATRRRLELWDLSDAQINQVLQSGQPIKNTTLYSPATGYVTDRKAFPQLKVTSETELYTIVDLSHVWIVADVFEHEAQNVRVGEAASVSFQALPGRVFNARITYIQPDVDPTTRTLKARLDMDNPALLLKPDMYADVELRVNLPSTLTVPAEAVLDAGERKSVFIDRGNGFFEPRRVTTGERVGNRIEILSGLRGGERVVSSGNFLIDSESQMEAAGAGMRETPEAGAMRQ